MMMLMEQGWPWLIIGILISAWGLHVFDVPVTEWIQILIKLPSIYFSDDTQTEKEQAKQTFEEVTQANPGCIILILGIIAIIVGLAKLLF